MYIALTHLGFWLRSAQNCRKSIFLDNLRTISQEGSMETFGLFWHVKYLNFDQKLPIRQPIIFFQKEDKTPYHVLSPIGNQEKVSANAIIPVCRGVYIHYFKINPSTFGCTLFSENYINPQVRINKIVNKNTADYRLSYFYGLLRALSLQSLS